MIWAHLLDNLRHWNRCPNRFLVLVAAVMACGACTATEPEVNVAELSSKPKAYVGSEKCKNCHLEHYDSWQMTLHSRMLLDAAQNKDAIVAELDPVAIKADLEKIKDSLKIPPDQFFIPKPEEVLYTIGSQWKQRYIVKKDGILVMAPIQFNTDTGRWVNYNEDKWEKYSWILKCGGCHATGVDIEKGTFEPAVGCEACHGPGSWHVALPKSALFEKRQTVVNPAKLTSGVAVQICGSCHNRGKATKHENAEWAVGYMPGKALETYFTSTSFAAGDKQHLYGNEFSKAHHQQFIDWKQSKHYQEGVACTSCHYVHQLGMSDTRLQTKHSGSNQCLSCHTQLSQNLAHSIHSHANCVGCHMPRVVKSAESGDLHSHVFKTLLPKETLTNATIPNSCQTCHKHKDADLAELQRQFDALSKLPKPMGQTIGFINDAGGAK